MTISRHLHGLGLRRLRAVHPVLQGPSDAEVLLDVEGDGAVVSGPGALGGRFQVGVQGSGLGVSLVGVRHVLADGLDRGIRLEPELGHEASSKFVPVVPWLLRSVPDIP